ncbi:MAG: MBL fold metallo-hydrolase, partial [Candidatus Micrarchaeia archaeon]
LGSKSVLEGCGEFEKEVPEYFKKMVAKWKSLKPGEKFNFGKEHDNASLTATKTVHEDKSGIGFVFHAEEEKVGYTGDTEDFNGLWGQYENCTVLVVNCLRPFRDKFPFHLSADEVADGVNSLIKRPAKIVLTHLGLKFIKAGQKQQQNRLEKATGTPTIIARERVVVKVKREKQQAL